MNRDGQPRKRKIRSATAERILQDLVARVEQVNANRELCFFVEELVLFGSHFRGDAMVGDIDIAFSLIRKTMAALSAKWDEMEVEQGVCFYDRQYVSDRCRKIIAGHPRIFDLDQKPYDRSSSEVKEILRNRSPYIDLALIDTIGPQEFPNRVIYEIPHRDALIKAVKRLDDTLNVEPLHRLLETGGAERRQPARIVQKTTTATSRRFRGC